MITPNIDEINASTIQERYIKKHYPKFHQYLINSYPNLSHSERMYWFYHDLKEFPKCHCGNPVKYINFQQGYQKCCCNKCVGLDPNIQQSKKESSLKHYGFSNPMQSKEICNKIKQTCLERYGVENVFMSKECKDKIKQTCLERYGTSHHLQNSIIKDKLVNTMRKKNIKEYDDLSGYTDNGEQIRECPHPECDKCKEKSYIIPTNIYYDRKRIGAELCTKLLKIGACHDSTLEHKILNLLDSYNIKYIRNSRKIMNNGQEIDIYIPSKKIGIECNGIWAHSSMNNLENKSSKYHINKTLECRNNNIQLLHLWEDWLIFKWDIVKSIILNKLSLIENKIYARCCELKIVEQSECINFLNENHIQGIHNSIPKSVVKYGLYYNDELVSLMVFSIKKSSRKSNINYEWELIRFCNKKYTNVVGGASRLLNKFKKDYNPKSIVSYSMNDISNGNLYKVLGFKHNNNINNTYWYFEPKTLKRLHHSSCTKTDIIRKYDDLVNPNDTEREMMRKLGYFQIYDSGQMTWVWTGETNFPSI